MQCMNKKIKGARETTYNNIKFRSKLEASLFKYLDIEGYKPKYEPIKFIVWEGFKPTIPFYVKDNKTKRLKLDNKKVIDITYTPDILFFYNDYIIIIEVKPFANDVYPYKRKLFRLLLEDYTYKENNKEYKPIFLQVGTKKNLVEFLTILNNEYNKES